ncbi:MAG TPA: PAS domain S-box protein, partial [Bacteroidales bacterium]|nr:PAS domain S-box protein [Bacteroidales bacterium]
IDLSYCEKNAPCLEEAWKAIQKKIKTDESAIEQVEINLGLGNLEKSVFRLILDRQGEYVLFSFAEVTEQIKDRELLFREKEFNRAILESMDDGVVACDHNGILTLFNQKARQWHNGGPMAMTRNDWARKFDLFETDGETPLSAEAVPLSRAFAGETVQNVAFTIKAPDQPLRHILANGGPLFDKYQKKQGAVIVMHDISERLRKEQSLKESEEIFRKLISTLPDVIVETDMFGNILFVNQQVVELGYVSDNSELIGKNVFSLIALEDRERALKNFIAMPEKSVGPVEYQVMFDGKPRLLCDVNGNMLRDADGIAYGMVFIIRDLSLQKKAGEQLRMLAHTIRSVSECISITDTRDRLIFVNDAFLKTYGFREEELIGKTMAIVRSDNNDPVLLKSILPSTLNGGWQGEIMNRRSDGFEFPIHLSTSAVRDENGHVICLVGISKDISEKREAERQLKIQDEMLRMTGEIAKVGGYEFDVATMSGSWTDEVARIHDLDISVKPDINLGL